jgi:hypothetical protein
MRTMPSPMEASGSVARSSIGSAVGTNVPQMSTATAASHSSLAVGGTEAFAAAGSGWSSS